jgi:hypothetical protein
MNVPAALSKCGIDEVSDNANAHSVTANLSGFALAVGDELCEFLAKRANERKAEIEKKRDGFVYEASSY